MPFCNTPSRYFIRFLPPPAAALVPELGWRPAVRRQVPLVTDVDVRVCAHPRLRIQVIHPLRPVVAPRLEPLVADEVAVRPGVALLLPPHLLCLRYPLAVVLHQQSPVGAQPARLP